MTDALGDVATVTLRCAVNACSRTQTVGGRHLSNVLAAGPWHCPAHRNATTPEIAEAPC